DGPAGLLDEPGDPLPNERRVLRNHDAQQRLVHQAGRMSTPYAANARSRVTIVAPNRPAWATSTRSNGSRWYGGKDPASSPSFSVIGRPVKLDAVMAAPRSSGA